MISKSSRIFVAGHKGLVGSSIIRKLKKNNYTFVITRTKKNLDLRNHKKVDNFFKKEKIDYVILAAAKVGGILANMKYGADFLTENLQIQTNVITACHKYKIKGLVYLGSSCIYPKFAKQPIKEDQLLTGELEPTNQGYAIAKIAGLMMCKNFNIQYKTNFKCLMPSNLFGPNDNYNLVNSHFLPAVIKKLYFAKINNKKEVIFWGTGKVKREMTYVDEIAEACIFFLSKKTKHTLINIGSGYEKTIKQYIKMVAKELKLNINIKFNHDKSLDGTKRKIVDCRIARSYGWKPKYNFNKYLKLCVDDFILNHKKYKN